MERKDTQNRATNSLIYKQLPFCGVGPGYKVRSQRNPVEPKSRGGVQSEPLLLRERRRCLLNKR